MLYTNRLNYYKWLVLIVTLVLAIFSGCSKLPEEEFDIKSPPAILQLEDVPAQPGIDGITIVGPKELIPIFRILPLHSGLPIDIEYLKQKQQQRPVNIEIIGAINRDGQLEIMTVDDGQFPDAANYITESLSKWTFSNYKTGPIKFWFDLAAKNRIVKINKTELQINTDATDVPVVKDGKLHNIVGLKQGDLGFSKF